MRREYAAFEIGKPENFVTDVEQREENPEWILLQIYLEKGFQLILNKSPNQESGILTETYEVLVEDAVKAASLGLRLDVVSQLPEFRLLQIADNPIGSPDILEQVVGGDVLNPHVQEEIPGAQLIKLPPDDLQGILALAYQRKQLWQEDDIRSISGEPTQYRHAIRFTGDKEAAKDVIRKLEPLVELARKKREEFGVRPILPSRIREILERVVEKTEIFLNA